MDKDTRSLFDALQKNLALLTDMQRAATVQKDISGTPDAQLIFGPQGIFSNFGLDDVVVNATITPRGMDRAIPVVATRELNPIYPYITGFDEDGNAEPAGPCDDAPGGYIETCHQTAQFGRYTRSSKEMEYNELVGVLNNHLTTNLRVLGSVLGDGHALLPGATGENSNFINSVIKTQMVVVGWLFQTVLGKQLWAGSPTNNNVGGGYREFPGLETLISTGKIDAFSGVACPALDSDVKDFNYNPVSGDQPDIVEYLSMMHYYLTHNASRMRLDPVEHMIVMRPQLFFELTRVWPVRYLTDRGGVTLGGSDAIVINDNNNIAMRDEMRQGNFLWINGQRVPVVTDDGIPEANSTTNANLAAGEFASDIYIVPLRAKGMPVLYWEHLDYRAALGDLSVLNNAQQFWPSDGGRFLWAAQQRNWCFKIQAKIEPRVVLRTPQLAGRLQHVKYSPLQHLRESDPDSPYRMKGGNEYYDTPDTLYSEWNPAEEQ